MKPSGWSKSLSGILGILAIVGLYISFDIANRRAFDPDMAHAIVVSEGIKAHGLQWLNGWQFTQDNWLFFLIPFQALLVHLTGEIVHTIAFSGWMIFVLAAVVSGLITKELAGRHAAWFVTVLTLWIGPYGHLEGYVSYPTSHNITNLFGLITLWLFLRWWARPRWPVGIAICALQLMAGLSDPWLLPAFTLPMLLSLGAGMTCRALFAGPSPGAMIRLIGGLALVFICVKTGVFGSADFMPPVYFEPGTLATLTNNLVYFLRTVGGLFAITFPAPNPDITWPETQWLFAAPPFIMAAGLFLYSIFDAFKKRSEPRYRLFLVFAAFSIGGISAAFLISSVAANLSSARFLVNIFYLVLIALVVFFYQHWSNIRTFYRWSILLLTGLFALSTFMGYIFFINKSDYLQSDLEIKQLIHTLDQHNLNYGYGPYHGSKSNAVTLLTHGRITIRPVAFDKPGGHLRFGHPQTALHWYKPEDAPKDQKRFFVYLNLTHKECPELNQCSQALFSDFGMPLEQIPFLEGVIYVWDHPLINQQTIPVHLGQPIRFDTSLNMPNWSGWSEPETWGIWSDGKSAFTAFGFAAPPQGDVQVQLTSRAYAPTLGFNQQVRVTVNGTLVATLEYTPEFNTEERRFMIPKTLLRDGQRFSMVFEINHPMSPRDRGINRDPRQLGIGLTEIVFSPATK